MDDHGYDRVVASHADGGDPPQPHGGGGGRGDSESEPSQSGPTRTRLSRRVVTVTATAAAATVTSDHHSSPARLSEPPSDAGFESAGILRLLSTAGAEVPPCHWQACQCRAPWVHWQGSDSEAVRVPGRAQAPAGRRGRAAAAGGPVSDRRSPGPLVVAVPRAGVPPASAAA